MKKTLFFICYLFHLLPAAGQIRGFYDGTTYYEEEVERNEPVKKSTHLSLYLGLSNYLGDLGGNEGLGKSFFYDNNLKKRTYFYGFSFTHFRREVLGIRLNYATGKIAGSDQDAQFDNVNDNAYTRYKRNLDFQSRISEGSLLLECYPLKLIKYTHAAHHWNLQPYAVLGLGLYSFNPQGSYFDEIADDYVWVDLKPLRTEGQGMSEYPFRKAYKLTQFNIPFGFGLQYQFSDKTGIGFEFIGRKLYTDYLDDVSQNYIDPKLFDKYLDPEQAQTAKIIHNKSNVIDPDHPYGTGERRGNPNNKDFYYSINLKFSVRISKIKDMTQVFRKKVYKYDNSEICN